MFTPLQRLLAVIFACFLFAYACNPSKKLNAPTGPVAGIIDSTAKWMDWVGVFKPGLSSTARENYFKKVKDQLLAVRSDYAFPVADSGDFPYTYHLITQIRDSFSGPFEVRNIFIDVCNCPEKQLFNIRADLMYGKTDTTGESTPSGIKQQTGSTVKGDEVLSMSDNEDMSNPNATGGSLNMEGIVRFDRYSRARSVLAIIDTGLDTMLLDAQLRRTVLWEGPTGGQNLLPGANVSNYFDDHHIKHGTAVATIAMNAFFREGDKHELPQLMILKAADASGHGTLFAYACALSFAIDNKANVINSSMGFYGRSTELIDYYLAKAKQKNIVVVTAAGNADKSHDLPLCRDNVDPDNELLPPDRMFFPAVMSNNQDHYMIMSVTGESEAGKPCYFQNYSSQYVTLGVVNKPRDGNCCFFILPFIAEGRGLEGTSFATPVVSGRLAAKIAQGAATPSSVRDCLDLLGNVNQSGGAPVTQANQYFEYEP